MKHMRENNMVSCECRAVSECEHNTFAWSKAIDACVDEFSASMRKKLKQKFMEGKSGWDDPKWEKKDILADLVKHIEKGDMVDVANIAMFAWNK